jgi:hypothetical protein
MGPEGSLPSSQELSTCTTCISKVKSNFFKQVTARSRALLAVCIYFWLILVILFDPEDGSSAFLQHVDELQ